ncbi:MAG: hypothetical protein KF716_01175 [Anaerolineae bacterium]|nr:hypothetical protein [Anaerolineae bacterium]
MEVFNDGLPLLSMLGALALAISIAILGVLSKRLGEVTRTPPYYRWFYVSSAVILGGILGRVIFTLQVGSLDAQAALLYDIPLVIGLLIAVLAMGIYWGWLLGERGKQPQPR